MALKLYLHPLASYCHKVLIALYENDTPFEPRLVDHGDPENLAAFRAVWPPAKMPVLRDEARDRTLPETSVIIEYLAQHYPGPTRFLPADPDLALEVRLWDRIFDLYLHTPMQNVVADRIRPADAKDPYGVAAARNQLTMACEMIEGRMADRTWAVGETFTLADCAAAPALYYADRIAPLGEAFPATAAYLQRLKARPSFARTLAEAEPYFHMFPG
ncbi:glutathione S-transferase family protein [Phenylobacterium hankyongense]|uniref:Glutathione S-transferase family protein n=1 Tax=Phenylobacterium hankyongense TaxID=1813876 RepID=A0A328B088_9CAUL|nr:glutathione S-transferase family protein [Phenylobacterium hankyongense]RAK60319.1 glutathione S-transferase family protein [Phenylobacterium hankyongense]